METLTTITKSDTMKLSRTARQISYDFNRKEYEYPDGQDVSDQWNNLYDYEAPYMMESIEAARAAFTPAMIQTTKLIDIIDITDVEVVKAR
jgi:hypothetical protein